MTIPIVDRWEQAARSSRNGRIHWRICALVAVAAVRRRALEENVLLKVADVKRARALARDEEIPFLRMLRART